MVDPQLGAIGLGLIEAHLTGARTWPAATINTAIALAQANSVLQDLRAQRSFIDALIGRAAGCDVAARMLADGRTSHILLIDPLGTSTRDAAFHLAERRDRGTKDPGEMARYAQPNSEADAVWSDPLLIEGRLPEKAYELLARGMSRNPTVRTRVTAALSEAEAARQPYDDRCWAPSSSLTSELDWISNLQNAPEGVATIWLSRDAEGRPPNHRQAHLEKVLPHVEVVAHAWEEYDFLVAPDQLAAEVQSWLENRGVVTHM